jgi:site-specific DNA-methyltransferase (adenine-specific)
MGKFDHLNGSDSGRFPANVIHDGSDEVEAEFAKAGTKTSGIIKPYTEQPLNPSSFNFAGREKPAFDYGDSGSPSRFFYTAKASRAERNRNLDGPATKKANHHPTVKPVALMAYLCRLISPPGGLILDPFNGSGSTGLGALQERFRYLGIELDAEYVEISKRRLSELQVNLF